MNKLEGSLKPDETKVNVDLAKEYLKKHHEIFDSITVDTEQEIILPNITCAPLERREALVQLAEKLQEHSRLFAELEYLRRGIQPEVVASCDIQLIVQVLLYCASTTALYLPFSDVLLMSPALPLAHLGFLAYGLIKQLPSKLHFPASCAPVCVLFTELCREVGFNIVPYVTSTSITPTQEVVTGCTGIISDHSDIDSAVDVFLDASTKYPWSLTRILVQESVYERFQSILDFKCKLKGEPTSTKFQDLCAKTFCFPEKVFLLDFFGDKSTTNAPNIVTVEGYRTTKELISLINGDVAPYVSLWNSDISEANEIAFKANVRAIWINDYGQFSGPPELSFVYYHSDTSHLERKSKVLQDWLKLDDGARSQILRECIQIYAQAHINVTHFVDKLQRSILSENCQKVEFSNGSVCVVDHRFVGVLLVESTNLDHISEAIACMKYGSAIEYLTRTIENCNLNIIELFRIMERKRLPVSENIDLLTDNQRFETKVVWTNFGTIFAN